MTRRIAIWVLLPLLVLLLLLGSGAWWILETGSGTRWLWHRVAAAVPGELAAESIDGALADRFSATGVRYVNSGVEVEVSSASFSMIPGMLPLAVTLSDVSIADVIVRQRRASSPGTEAASLKRVLSALRLPFRLQVESLALDSLRVLSHDQRQIFAMQSVGVAGYLHQAIALDRARLDLGGFKLEATGWLGLNAPNAVDGAVTLRIDREAAGQFPGMPVNLDAKLRGDLDAMQVDASSDLPQFRITGTVREPGRNPHWDLRLQSGYLQWPLESQQPLVRGKAIDVTGSGRLQDYALRGNADVEIRQSGVISASLEAGGTTTGLDVDELQLSGNLVDARLRGGLDWSSGFAIRGVADVTRFDPHPFLDAWPAGRTVYGDVDAAWSRGGIELSGLRARVAGSPMRLESTGTIEAQEGIVDLALDWRELQWPIDGGQPRIESDSGRVRLAGRLDDWLVDGRISLEVAKFPEGSFVLSGQGDRGQVAIRLEESRILGGTAAGTVRYDWRHGGEWSASLSAGNLHTQPLVADWPGVLNAAFTANGRVDPFLIDVALRRFDGTLRGLPVEGSGGVRYAPGELRFSRLHVNSGDSSIEVDGSLRSDVGIDFSLDVAAIGAFMRTAAGSVTASGKLALEDGFPALQLELEGSDLAWRQLSAGRLTISGSDDPQGRPIGLRLRAEEVALGGRAFETVTALLRAGPDAQALEAEVAGGDAALHVVLDGALADWRHPLDSVWSGRVESLGMSAGRELQFALKNPAGLRLSRDAVAIDETCLGDDAALRICGNGRWSGAGDFHGAANLTAFPVDALGLIVDTGLEFTQTLDGAMTFSRTPDRALSGDVRLDLSAGRIRNRLDSRLETTTRPGRLGMHLENGRLLSGKLNLPFSNASEIDAHFEVLDVAAGEASPVEGQLHLQVADVGAAANVLPVIDAAAGRLAADITVSGTLGRPRFTGNGSLGDGSLSYAPLGLRVTDMQLRGNIKEQNRLELEGTFRAGEGSGRLYTSADYLAGRQAGLRVSLTGQNLTVVDVPDVRVVANPELDFGLHEGTVTINGRIVVPQARLSPENLATTPTRESEDVVVVSGQDAKAEEAPAEEPAVAINGAVDLLLGDDIIVELDATEARVRGRTTFRWSDPAMPVADGQYQVTGKFQAYGQLLEITEGTVNFPNVPADNPELRIRAEREIFGNSQIRSAGVFITGTAKDPEVEVYTNPETTESRALTLLVTGSDFDFEQGVGAVDVGTYIAPKLFLSYGIGLFDRDNVISVRYDLAKGFGIKASSSTRTDGVDLSYTIER